jgi:hypothetical protein
VGLRGELDVLVVQLFLDPSDVRSRGRRLLRYRGLRNHASRGVRRARSRAAFARLMSSTRWHPSGDSGRRLRTSWIWRGAISAQSFLAQMFVAPRAGRSRVASDRTRTAPAESRRTGAAPSCWDAANPSMRSTAGRPSAARSRRDPDSRATSMRRSSSGPRSRWCTCVQTRVQRAAYARWLSQIHAES